MAEKLKIISLGGLNEIGKNMTVYEYGGGINAIDAGMGVCPLWSSLAWAFTTTTCTASTW